MYPIIEIKPGRENSLLFRHPWIFSGALKKIPPDIRDGHPVYLADSDGKIIATGTYSAKSMIAVRIFAFEKKIIDSEWFRSRFLAAEELRRLNGYGENTETTGYRLLYGESDGVPGLVVDRFDKTLVFQIATAGTDSFRNLIVPLLADIFKPETIIERSDMISRREEGLEEIKKVHIGSLPEQAIFSENGLRFAADPWNGQKTGFFLDQKETRRAIRQLSKGRRILNLFSYSGSFGVAAIIGGGLSVHNVDSSAEALRLSHLNGALNDIDNEKISVETADIFDWLSARNEPQYDMVILDPPALIKSRADTGSGKKAYHFLNRAALRLINNGGILVSSSCSAFFGEDDFMLMLRRASIQAGVDLDLLSIIWQSPDHPISLYFPESAYLKTFICRVTRTAGR